MTTLDPVAAALAAAQQQAAATPAPTAVQGGAVAVATPASGAVGGNMTTAAVATPLSMESLMMGGMSVEGWIKPSEYGLKIGDNPGLAAEIDAILDLTEGVGFISKMAIKGGNPAQYAYTTDMVNAAGGGSWADAQARIRAVAPTASPYRCVDLPFTMLNDVSVVAPGAPATAAVVAAKAGQRLGYTTSTTNWANWETFYRECAAAGLIGKRVHVKLGAQRRTNKANNVWGVMTFKLVAEVEADAE